MQIIKQQPTGDGTIAMDCGVRDREAHKHLFVGDSFLSSPPSKMCYLRSFKKKGVLGNITNRRSELPEHALPAREPGRFFEATVTVLIVLSNTETKFLGEVNAD